MEKFINFFDKYNPRLFAVFYTVRKLQLQDLSLIHTTIYTTKIYLQISKIISKLP